MIDLSVVKSVQSYFTFQKVSDTWSMQRTNLVGGLRVRDEVPPGEA